MARKETFEFPHGRGAEENVAPTHIKIAGCGGSMEIFQTRSNSGKSFVSDIVFRTPEGTERIHTVGRKIKGGNHTKILK